MQVTRQSTPLDLPLAVVATGVFDGVHLGHQAVLTEVRRRAAERGCPSIVIVGEPPPGVRLLTTVEERLALMEAFGIDRCVLVAGEPQTFDGEVEIPPVCLGATGEPISSSAIRSALDRGDISMATEMLGRPYELRGVVEHGDRRGRTIGFPTANLGVSADLQLPADGVYGGWYRGDAGTEHLAAINLGRRPTFYDEGIRLLEAYLLDFAGDLYGDHARVRFGRRLRDELKFDSVGALVAQMHDDVKAVRALAVDPARRSAGAVEGAS